MKNKKMSLGAAFLGALLAGLLVGDVAARTAGWLYGRSLRVASTEGRDGSPGTTLGDGDAYVQDNLEVDGAIRTPAPTTQALAAGFTITADACGGVKRVSATADVTSDTTNTFTAAATAGECKMLIINVAGSHEILLDGNTEFPLAGGAASLRLAAGGSIWVWSNGTQWYHGPYTEY